MLSTCTKQFCVHTFQKNVRNVPKARHAWGRDGQAKPCRERNFTFASSARSCAKTWMCQVRVCWTPFRPFVWIEDFIRFVACGHALLMMQVVRACIFARHQRAFSKYQTVEEFILAIATLFHGTHYFFWWRQRCTLRPTNLQIREPPSNDAQWHLSYIVGQSKQVANHKKVSLGRYLPLNFAAKSSCELGWIVKMKISLFGTRWWLWTHKKRQSKMGCMAEDGSPTIPLFFSDSSLAVLLWRSGIDPRNMMVREALIRKQPQNQRLLLCAAEIHSSTVVTCHRCLWKKQNQALAVLAK